ncbi:MAG: hypothetical protein ROR55_13610 [Devosia sp.]
MRAVVLTVLAAAALAGAALWGSATPSFAQSPLLRAQFVPPPAKEGFRYPDCFCTDTDGARVEVGDFACLRIGSRRVLAQCGMSQNSPAWRERAKGCPVS